MALPEQLIPFLFVVIVLTVIPGPDTALGLRNSLRGGSSAMWWTGLGVCSGLLVHATVSTLGLSAVFAASATAYAGLKLAGALYLLWLGAGTLWGVWRGRRRAVRAAAEPLTSVGTVRAPLTRAVAFRQGVLNDLLNPKIAVLFLTLLPQFIGPEEPRVRTSFVLTFAFVGVALVWWRLTSSLVGLLHGWLTRPRVRARLECLTGGVLLALGIRVAFDAP
ncbi:Threonine/homoserine/homoserine lactone efflux protein [Streptomyces zhaozhouensis]|uniref:Threonine/homoserine/homoserine lactone efflux protein n=1 Tax=Streptomyces zhaozhouensis TaxID=1300267 RepID=A0A286DUG0_9ACTN|nr:LysE family translocator [Streptomyces zhaozhouensis]SOD62299.1 Threonine/homoserine/homoserine lactone efflux protein [Streptomyces zhaozhouensis]